MMLEISDVSNRTTGRRCDVISWQYTSISLPEMQKIRHPFSTCAAQRYFLNPDIIDGSAQIFNGGRSSQWRICD
jgi:hypothetical protein